MNRGDLENDDGTFSNTRILTNSGTINSSAGFTNSGLVTISSSGILNNTGTNYNQVAGITIVDSTLTATGGAIVNIQGGTLGGTGTINGNVLMAGTVTPDDGAPGKLTIFGNYEQTGSGGFDELMSSSSQSLLIVNGSVVLDPGALLEISLLGGFNPLGQTFDIMDYGSLTGEFVNGASFWDDGYSWDVSYGQNQIDTFLPALALGSLAIGAFVKRKRVAQ